MSLETWIVLLIPLVIGAIVAGVVIHRVKSTKKLLVLYSSGGILYVLIYAAYLNLLK